MTSIPALCRLSGSCHPAAGRGSSILGLPLYAQHPRSPSPEGGVELTSGLLFVDLTSTTATSDNSWIPSYADTRIPEEDQVKGAKRLSDSQSHHQPDHPHLQRLQQELLLQEFQAFQEFHLDPVLQPARSQHNSICSFHKPRESCCCGRAATNGRRGCPAEEPRHGCW